MSTTDEISPRPSLTAAPVAVRDIHKTVVPLDNPTAAVSAFFSRVRKRLK
ncbi:hypothetical protein U8Q06_34820 (plasmid) [Rhizobium beringeri]|nr:hypothetical protein U8Q06_34820 [Rhizobium beringeri]